MSVKWGDFFNKLFAMVQGRHTFFALLFAVFGCILQWFGKLDGNFIALIAAVQSFVFAHSAKEDYFANKASAPGGTDAK